MSAEQIHALTLRYIIVRRFKDAIRQAYICFGETDAEPTVETDEGELKKTVAGLRESVEWIRSKGR